MKDELLVEYAMITTDLQARDYNIDEIRSLVRDNEKFLPERIKEIYRGMAEVTGLIEDDAYVLYYGPILYLTTPYACSYLAVWDEYTVNSARLAELGHRRRTRTVQPVLRPCCLQPDRRKTALPHSRRPPRPRKP